MKPVFISTYKTGKTVLYILIFGILRSTRNVVYLNVGHVT